MPIFEHECDMCGNVVEVIAKQGEPKTCKKCGAEMALKVSASARTPDKWK